MNDDTTNDELCTCEWCGEECEELADEVDGEAICQDCYDNRTAECEWCRELRHADHVNYANGYEICDQCFEDGRVRFCENCGTACSPDDMTWTHDDENVCFDCEEALAEGNGGDTTRDESPGRYALDFFSEQWLTEADAERALSEGRPVVLASNGEVVWPMQVAA